MDSSGKRSLHRPDTLKFILFTRNLLGHLGPDYMEAFIPHNRKRHSPGMVFVFHLHDEKN